MDHMNELHEKIVRLKTLSVIPDAGQRILELLQDDDSGVDRVAQEIARNPDICARIIGMANSAFFGRAGRIQRIADAVIVIGCWRRVKTDHLCRVKIDQAI